MIAKVIVHARTRELAIARMRRALDAMVIEGIKTTIPLHLKIMDDPKFQAGDISTRFMEEFPGAAMDRKTGHWYAASPALRRRRLPIGRGAYNTRLFGGELVSSEVIKANGTRSD